MTEKLTKFQQELLEAISSYARACEEMTRIRVLHSRKSTLLDEPRANKKVTYERLEQLIKRTCDMKTQ